MPYADTDFFVALVKESDWLDERAETVLAEYRGDLRTSLATFIELFWLCDEYGLNRERVVAHVLELAETDFDENVVFQADEYVDEGLNVLDAFHAAAAGSDRIISSDKKFDDIGIERLRLEEVGEQN